MGFTHVQLGLPTPLVSVRWWIVSVFHVLVLCAAVAKVKLQLYFVIGGDTVSVLLTKMFCVFFCCCCSFVLGNKTDFVLFSHLCNSWCFTVLWWKICEECLSVDDPFPTPLWKSVPWSGKFTLQRIFSNISKGRPDSASEDFSEFKTCCKYRILMTLLVSWEILVLKKSTQK